MKREKLSKAAASGAVALIFLVLGFQAAIFTGNVFRYNREHQVDTVFVQPLPGSGIEQDSLRAREQDFLGRQVPPQRSEARKATQQASRRSGAAKGIAPKREPDYGDSRRILSEKLERKPKPELFEFDPNTVTKEELMRLGFSERQAQVIENYRAKGGKYRKPRDFAKMYVVDSAHFARLEPYIRIRKINLNTADSLQLVSLRGIGPYYAHKILEYRARLGGVFTDKNQLLEIEGIDADRLSGFAEGVEVKPVQPRYSLWTATKSELASHPYIGSYVAKGIFRYKSVADTTLWTIAALVDNGVLTFDAAARLEYLDIRP
ncbi:MAG: helix-hairpin-helix domain-containing protein [Bacteroidales bacterium]|nr:helix-hairpin-helix domain-containing protein [Bacteroidales bacterium]